MQQNHTAYPRTAIRQRSSSQKSCQTFTTASVVNRNNVRNTQVAKKQSQKDTHRPTGSPVSWSVRVSINIVRVRYRDCRVAHRPLNDSPGSGRAAGFQAPTTDNPRHACQRPSRARVRNVVNGGLLTAPRRQPAPPPPSGRRRADVGRTQGRRRRADAVPLPGRRWSDTGRTQGRRRVIS